MIPIEQFKVESESSRSTYTVSRCMIDQKGVSIFAESWSCSCVGWTRHVPRKDCKHIRYVKQFGAVPVDPLLMAVEKSRRKLEVV